MKDGETPGGERGVGGGGGVGGWLESGHFKCCQLMIVLDISISVQLDQYELSVTL